MFEGVLDEDPLGGVDGTQATPQQPPVGPQQSHQTSDKKEGSEKG
jgi:hypothetical protein